VNEQHSAWFGRTAKRTANPKMMCIANSFLFRLVGLVLSAPAAEGGGAIMIEVSLVWKMRTVEAP